MTTLSTTAPREVLRDLAMALRDAPVAATRVLLEAMRPVTGRRPRWIGGGYFIEAAILIASLDRVGIRHIHVHFANNAAEIARLACALDRTKGPDARGLGWSMTIHGLWMHGEGSADSPFPTRDERRFGRLTDKHRDASAVAVIDDFARRRISSLRSGDPDPEVIRMGVDVTTFVPDAAVIPGSRPFTVLTVGRLAPEKDLTVLLDAFAMADPGNWRLRIVGEGPLEQELRRHVSALGLVDSVEFLGRQVRADLIPLYQQADVVVMSSKSEGIPTVLMEAMACGVPVVTTRVGGIPELVVEGTGRLVDVGDVRGMADCLRAYADDPGAARRAGAKARERVVDAFDQRRRSDRWSTFLVEAMSRSGARAAPRSGVRA